MGSASAGIHAIGFLITIAVTLFLPSSARAQSGTWTNTQSGTWSDTSNWLGGIVADSTNNVADFSKVDLTTAVTNHLDSPRTIGRLTLGDTNPGSAATWTLDDDGDTANVLTFEGTTIQPGITVSNETTISAPIKLLGATCDIDVLVGGVLAVEGSLDTAGDTTLKKTGGGVLKIAGRYGASVTRPQSRIYSGTVHFSSNTVFSNGIETDTGGANIAADNATITGGWSVELKTVNLQTGVFDMHGGSLNVNQIGMARGIYGANQSITTIGGDAIVSASSGIQMGDNQATGGGATCFVLKSGSVDIGGGVIVIGIRAGENVFNHLGGTITTPRNQGTPFNGTAGALTLQYRMNKSDNYACLYNLNGGTLLAGSVVTGDGTPFLDAPNTAYFNFHGGILKPAMEEDNFFRTTLTVSGTDLSLLPGAEPHVVVWSEGAVFDTDGHGITSQVPFAAPSGSGLYADTNRNLTLFLSEANAGAGYKATPLIRIGSLISGNTATAVANMVDDGTGEGTLKVESITLTNPGMNYTVPRAIGLFGGDPTTPATPPVLVVATNFSGGLTKMGAGTLTLSATNTYTGDTIVSGGTLANEHACLADEADLYIARNATFAIEFDGEDVINGLYVNDVAIPKGKYYSGDLGTAILGSGSGYLKVTSGSAAGLQLLVR